MDDPDLRELIAMSVEGAGLRAVCATDGITAARILETATPRAIVTDVGMPAMTGLELCRLVRSQAQLRHLPVIMVSAAIDDADIEAGYAAGATDYLVKPFSPRRFRTRLTELLGHQAPIGRRVPAHARPYRFATPAGPRNMSARWRPPPGAGGLPPHVHQVNDPRSRRHSRRWNGLNDASIF